MDRTSNRAGTPAGGPVHAAAPVLGSDQILKAGKLPLQILYTHLLEYDIHVAQVDEPVR